MNLNLNFKSDDHLGNKNSDSGKSHKPLKNIKLMNLKNSLIPIAKNIQV